MRFVDSLGKVMRDPELIVFLRVVMVGEERDTW